MDDETLGRTVAGTRGAVPFLRNGKSPDEALAALSAWSVLEALSPRTYGQPKDLVEGQGELVRVEEGRLPWNEPVEPRNNYDIYYRVSLGSVDMRRASRAILDAFGWDEGAASAQGSHALLGMILLDGRGAPVASGTGVSSFGWALPLVLGKNLGKMARWGEVENDAVEALNEMLARPDPDREGKLLPLTWADIGKAHDALVERFGVEPGFVDGPGLAVRFEHRIRPGSVPSPYLLNSFLLGGIERVHRLVSSEDGPPVALGAYMGLHAPLDRIDVLGDRKGLALTLHPGAIPLARWPAPGGHPLVTLQQAAVNAVMARSGAQDGEGVVAVNGPPGTGKTTMLRDVVAGNLVGRALAMARADDPEDLFTQVKLGGRRSLYVLDEGLRGFEMVVASSNNKAVENVSREMPQRGSVDAGAGVPRYFGATSDFLAGISLNPKAKPAPAGAGTWGLVSAALGNASNRSAFMEGFWWNEDHGIRTWLRLAKGEDVKVAVTDGKGKVVGERAPYLLKVESPPRGRPAALAAWKAVRKRFLEAHAKLERQFEGLADFERERERIPALEAEYAAARAAIEKARQAKDPVLVLAERIERAKDDLASAQGELERLEASRPRDPSQGSGQVEHDIWAAERDEARLLIEAHQRTCARLERAYQLESGRREDDGGLQAAITASAVVKDRLDRAREKVAAWAARVGDRAVDDAFFEAGHAAWNVSSPWMDDALQAERAELFGLAMEVHQAFALAASRPLLRNLAAYAEITGNGGSSELRSYAPDLWSSLFLVVPVVSTTFASAGRMLDGLPPESLGWLIVDEAGQATPQAPIGALAVCRRALFVGDPLQVEPVTTLPQRLVGRVCEHFGVDQATWTAPEASAQAFADRVSPLCATFDAVDGEREVGMPLLVHRRCQNPMFRISNEIAYEGQMVHAAGPDRGDEARMSAWFDITGTHEGKWCQAEGDFAAAVLRRMGASGEEPDVFFISPFREVAANLRSRLAPEAERFSRDAAAWVRDRVGTIHTFQGREATSVVLVLGAGGAEHAGARRWASRAPNIANVAVTRAKSRLYVVGNQSAWGSYGAFKTVAAAMPLVDASPRGVRAPAPAAPSRQSEEQEPEQATGLRAFRRAL